MKMLLLILCCIVPAARAQQPTIQQLMSKNLTDMPGKEGVMISVTFPPGYSDGVHRHNAYVFVYVLEGSVVMQLKGKPPVTLNPGDTFYESPKDIHIEGKNASDTKPARFIAFFVKDRGAPILVPATSAAGLEHQSVPGAWKSGKLTALPTFPRLRLRRRSDYHPRCATQPRSLVQKTGQARKSDSLSDLILQIYPYIHMRSHA